MSAYLNAILQIKEVREGISYTVDQLSSKWRKYEPRKNYNYRCVVAIWSILEQVKKKRIKFENAQDLAYYLFGNRNRKNRVFWAVEKDLKHESGIRSFKNLPDVDFQLLENVLSDKTHHRERLIRKIEAVFCKDHLTKQEKIVLSLHYNLSCEDEGTRAETDTRPWSTKEIAKVLKINEVEVTKTIKSGLAKLRPLIREDYV